MKKLTFILSTLFFTFSLFSQSFQVEVSFDTVYLGNTVEVTFIAENMNGRIEPNMQGLPVIAGPSQRSNTSIINGVMSSSKSFTYVLQPQEAGIIEIPPAYLYLEDGEVEETIPLTLLILDNPDNIIQRKEAQRDDWFFSDPFSRPLPRRDQKRPKKQKRKLKKI